MFRQGFSCPALLVVTLVPHTGFRIRGYHPLWPDFPFRSTIACAKNNRLFHVRSPLLTESRLISFPRATQMFQFTRFATTSLYIQEELPLSGGFPHSDISGSKLVCQLPETLRRLPRPSSPVIAQASTICTYSLDPITLIPEPFLNSDILRMRTPLQFFLKLLFLLILQGCTVLTGYYF